MLIIGVILIITGFMTFAFGILQNTLLFMLFADVNAQLARFHSGSDFEISWLFANPGSMEMIIGSIMIFVGIILIVLRKKREKVHDEDE